uniref:Myristylated membrane protein n=1 Tax=Rhinella marina erythrocytic-like virus TaxID=2859906 RepID=A0A8F6UAW9_9VIRU|nr:myristylated membrane protein [Rhinella marina erythrocytic-like virus]
MRHFITNFFVIQVFDQNIDHKMEKTHLTFIQTDRSKPYAQNSCYCGYCGLNTKLEPCDTDGNSIGDWVIGYYQCCGGLCADQFKCVRVASDPCKTASFVGAAWDKKAPNVKCFFDLAKLRNNLDEVSNLVDRFGIKQKFMWDVCKVPIADEKGELTNSIHTKGKRGDLCRSWFETLNNREKTTFIREYCVTYPDATDCKCANRGKDPLYRDIKRINAVNDGCWYTHCADTTTQFVEPALQEGSCPTILCSSIVNILNNKGNVNIENFNANVICGNKSDIKDTPVYKPPEKVDDLESMENPTDTVSALLVATAVTAMISLFI